MRPPERPARVRQAHVEWVNERLAERDRAVMATVDRLRLATGAQLERVDFAELSDGSRARTRRRVLARLTDWRVLTPLERRIGGVRAGSSGLVFALDSAGQWLLRSDEAARVRRPYTPGLMLVRHTLAVSELYVTLVEQARYQPFTLTEFLTEPACWYPDGLGGWLRPDAYMRLDGQDYGDSWWLEQDMSTEHVPTITRKLSTYLDFVEHGQLGPGGITPRVLVSVPDGSRQAAVQRAVERLPDPASKLFHVTTAAQASHYLVRILHE